MAIYLLRGLAVALSEFVLLYACFWLVVSGGWSLWTKNPGRARRSIGSNVLFALQLLPFAASAVLVLSLAIPAFLRFEPRAGEEEFGFPILFLGLLCLVLFAIGAWRAKRALQETRRLIRRWGDNAEAAESIAGVASITTEADAPPLLVAGLLRPRLYVSSSASDMLSEEELARAIAHESAHVKRHDNLKKFFLRLCCVPSTSGLERHWMASVEIAADMDAVRSRREALDLASALVKASKIAAASPDLAMTFTADAGQLLRMRVERLLAWDDASTKHSSRKLALTIGLATACAMLATPWYSTVLLAVHRFSEVLVR